MRKKNQIIIVLFVSLMIVSCGTTSIVVNNADVGIYVNNVYKGKGHAEVRRTGVPKKMTIEAKYQGSTVGQLVVKRKFDAITFLSCYLTYGIGTLFTFRYPALVNVPTTMDETKPNTKPQGIWKRPPSSWNK